MDGVGQGVTGKRLVFVDRARKLRTVGRNTAGKNEFLDYSFVSVCFGNSFHHPGGTGDVDLPHAFHIQHSGLYRINHKCQMNDRYWANFPKQIQQLVAGVLLAQIHRFEAQLQIIRGRAEIDPHRREIRQL